MGAGAEVPVVAEFALVDGEVGRAVVVFGDEGGDFGLLARGIANFLVFADPALLRDVFVECDLLILAHNE